MLANEAVIKWYEICLQALNMEIAANCLQVTSPGTWLVKRDDLRLIINLFGQIRSTRYVSAIFPLLFDETFRFDKVLLHALFICYVNLFTGTYIL